MIAALYVQTNGAYFNLPGVDPWDERRDARLYEGPHPVVAHPPCARWCRLAGLVEARYPHLRKGEDGGCFKRALEDVRRFHGVLEHPAYSDAWPTFKLPKPDPKGGWSAPDEHGGRSCHVEQRHYGHRARKATWLYAVSSAALPTLAWGKGPDPELYVSSCSKRGDGTFIRRRGVELMGKREASATPEAFKKILLEIAYLAGLVRKS